MEFKQIQKRLEQMLSKDRYEHSIGVSESAGALAARYGADTKKAALAGLVHDCAKEIDYDEMVKMCERNKIVLDEVARAEKKLIHAYVGAHYAKEEFGIHDDEIYDAVFYHTTGKANMPLLTKIIYVADFIEPNRTYEGVEEIRKTAFSNIDFAILEGLNYTIIKTVGKKRMLHPATINARNYIISNIR